MDPHSDPLYPKVDMGVWVDQLFLRLQLPNSEFLNLMRDQLRYRHLCCTYLSLCEEFHDYDLGKGGLALSQEDCSDI